jgi:hypothetical protein
MLAILPLIRTGKSTAPTIPENDIDFQLASVIGGALAPVDAFNTA